MYQINAHVLPKKLSENYEKFKGAYAVIFIQYADIDGAFALAKYYIENGDWIVDELEEEYFVYESADNVEEDYLEFYNEALNTGYSILFNCYLEDEL